MSDATPPPSAPPSPLLHLPGAVGGNGIDAPVAAHYGSFNGEQRTLVERRRFRRPLPPWGDPGQWARIA